MKKTNTIKTRMIAAILGTITVISTASAAAVTSVSAAEAPQYSTAQLEKELKEYKDYGLNKLIEMVDQKVPGGFLLTPVLKTVLGDLYEKNGDAASMESISADVNKLFEQIKSFEANMKKELGNVLDTKLFDYTSFQPLNSVIAGINNDMNSYKTGKYTDRQRLGKIAALIGSNCDWNKDNHAFVKFTTITNELNNASFLGKNDMFQTIYNYFKSRVMLSGEAYDLAKPVADNVMKNYIAAYTVLMQSLTAQLKVAEMKDRSGIDEADLRNICLDKATIITRINYLNKQVFGTVKTVDGKQVLDNSNTVAKKYEDVFSKKAFDRMVLVDKGKDNHKLAKALFMNHSNLNASGYKNAAEEFNKWLKDGNNLSHETAMHLAEYAGAKGKTIREFLNENGFDLKKIPANAKLVTGGASADEEITFANAFKVATGSLYLHTEYKGINIDAKNPKEETVRLWNEGFNLWKGDGLGKFERHASSGVAACF